MENQKELTDNELVKMYEVKFCDATEEGFYCLFSSVLKTDISYNIKYCELEVSNIAYVFSESINKEELNEANFSEGEIYGFEHFKIKALEIVRLIHRVKNISLEDNISEIEITKIHLS